MLNLNVVPKNVAEWYIRDQQASPDTSISVKFSSVSLKEAEEKEDRNARIIEAIEERLEKMFLKPPLYGGGMLHAILNVAVIAAFKQYKKNGNFTVADAFLLSRKNRQRFWGGVEVSLSEVLETLQITKREYSETQKKADRFIDLFYDFYGEDDGEL